MTLGHIARNSFQEAFKKLLKKNVPIKTAFKLKGIAKTINDELAKYNELKNALILEYAEKDEAGNPKEEVLGEERKVRLDVSRLKEFVTKLRELDSLEVEIQTIPVEELGENNLLPEDLLELDFIVEK